MTSRLERRIRLTIIDTTGILNKSSRREKGLENGKVIRSLHYPPLLSKTDKPLLVDVIYRGPRTEILETTDSSPP
jgi:hypothetical protein